MKPHVKIYLTAMSYDVSDFIFCEVCEAQAVDIHHIESRGMGGTKREDTIDNLMAMCRKCHSELGDIKELKEKLLYIHQLRMRERGI